MTRTGLVLALLAGIGASLLLGELRGFRATRLADRIEPYVAGRAGRRSTAGALSVASFREVVGPLATSLGDGASRLLGVSEPLAVKLERIHSSMSVGAFRTRQLGESVLALALGAGVAVALGPPAPLVLVFLLGAPALAFLLREQQVSRASSAWQRRLLVDLPVATEQLGMLLGAGYSVGGALNRLAGRGSGACAADLRRACGRMRQGLSERAALDEWAELAAIPAVHRLVGVLSLNREANDLSRLISEEARSMRRDAHRRLIEAIERRGQQVWIPVTVATLVPGVLFMVVPFVQAMRLFTSS